MKDNFSQQAAGYAQYRPDYPPSLFGFILAHTKGRAAAWDCATGNGQTAKELARYYEKVFATDISQKQLDHAVQRENIIYSLQPAEHAVFDNDLFDLVTVSQALHWFDFAAFYAEVRRVGKPGGAIAVWTYPLLRISAAIDAILDHYHFQTLGPYWDSERKYVDAGYATIPFPFEEIAAPSFVMEYEWTLPVLEGYLRTWSALAKFMAKNDHDPVIEVIQRIRPLWNTEKMKISFPVCLRMGRIDK